MNTAEIVDYQTGLFLPERATCPIVLKTWDGCIVGGRVIHTEDGSMREDTAKALTFIRASKGVTVPEIQDALILSRERVSSIINNLYRRCQKIKRIGKPKRYRYFAI